MDPLNEQLVLGARASIWRASARAPCPPRDIFKPRVPRSGARVACGWPVVMDGSLVRVDGASATLRERNGARAQAFENWRLSACDPPKSPDPDVAASGNVQCVLAEHVTRYDECFVRCKDVPLTPGLRGLWRLQPMLERSADGSSAHCVWELREVSIVYRGQQRK